MINFVPRIVESVAIGPMKLPGELALMENTLGLVVIVHGSASGRHTLRNEFVARVLRSYGLGTLLFDLLTQQEAGDDRKFFEIDLLCIRVTLALNYLGDRHDLAGLPLGLFGAGTGAAAALLAGACHPNRVNAIVSCGGRPDLIGKSLGQVRAATLLLAGGEDPEVLELNRAAMQVMTCPKRLEVVAGATHSFEEPGTLDLAASLAGHWFENRFSQREGVPGR